MGRSNSFGNSNIRSDTRKRPVHYESRVTRSVTANQPGLVKPLRLLAEHTKEFIDYKPIGQLGVTLVMLEPLLRQIFSKNRNGKIKHENLSDFEAELNGIMDYSHYAGYPVNIHDTQRPLALYGKQEDHLGFRLDENDYRLVGDRAMIEAYIHDKYDASKRFIDKNLIRFRPHITAGIVKYEAFETKEDRQYFQDDPSDFLISSCNRSMEAAAESYGLIYDQKGLVMPETIALNGLRIFCQQK